MDSEEFVDLRSDTVTLPTDEMLEAIRRAKLGDDVFGEDPTVKKLEEMAAEKMGKDAALLVTSGTQANLVSLLSNTKRGDSIILEAESHIYYYEVGGLSFIAGLLPILVRGKNGYMDPVDLEAVLRPKDIHYPEVTLICIENTHNRAGGTIIRPEQIKAIYDFAKAHNLKLYMDGARIFNAAVALKTDVKNFTKNVDNLMFCLSKGLSCPIGSIVVGDYDFIERARKFRKMLGGGMRQAGIIAAPGIIALEKMIDRLEEDHRNARMLAEALSKIDGISIDLSTVQTNIVMFDVNGLGISAPHFVELLKNKKILCLPFSDRKVRMVTHRGIDRVHIEKTISVIEELADQIHKKW